METILIVILAQWAVLGPLVAMKYAFNNNKNDNSATAQKGGRVHGR